MFLTCYEHVRTLVVMVDEMGEITMDKYTQFKGNFPSIKAPRWHDSTLVIRANVAEHNKLSCTYVRPDGTRMFPTALYVSGAVARKYKPFKMPTRSGNFIKMRAIPISEFKRLVISDRSMHA